VPRKLNEKQKEVLRQFAELVVMRYTSREKDFLIK